MSLIIMRLVVNDRIIASHKARIKLGLLLLVSAFLRNNRNMLDAVERRPSSVPCIDRRTPLSPPFVSEKPFDFRDFLGPSSRKFPKKYLVQRRLDPLPPTAPTGARHVCFVDGIYDYLSAPDNNRRGMICAVGGRYYFLDMEVSRVVEPCFDIWANKNSGIWEKRVRIAQIKSVHTIDRRQARRIISKIDPSRQFLPYREIKPYLGADDPTAFCAIRTVARELVLNKLTVQLDDCHELPEIFRVVDPPPPGSTHRAGGQNHAPIL